MNEGKKIEEDEVLKEKNSNKENVMLLSPSQKNFLINGNNQENNIIKEIEYALKKKKIKKVYIYLIECQFLYLYYLF